MLRPGRGSNASWGRGTGANRPRDGSAGAPSREAMLIDQPDRLFGGAGGKFGHLCFMKFAKKECEISKPRRNFVNSWAQKHPSPDRRVKGHRKLLI